MRSHLRTVTGLVLAAAFLVKPGTPRILHRPERQRVNA